MTSANDSEPVAVMKRGYLREVARQNSETWAVGDILYGKSNGSITKTRPAGPLPQVIVGTVFETVGVQHTIDVDVRVLPNIAELSGVTREAPVDTDLFVYNSTTHCWVPRLMFAAAPGPTGQPNDGEVLYWDTTNKQALGSTNLVFNDSTKSIALTGSLAITSDAAGTKPLTVKAHASQAANLQEWQNSSSTPLAYVEKGGAIKSLGLIEAVVAKTTTYTATINDHVIKCNASGGAFTITLPAAATSTGLMLHIKKTDSSVNAVTIDGNASELVEDAVTQTLVRQGENLMLQCDGTGWNVL